MVKLPYSDDFGKYAIDGTKKIDKKEYKVYEIGESTNLVNMNLKFITEII